MLDYDNLGMGLRKRGKEIHLFVLQFIEVGFRSRMKTNKALTAIRTASLHSHHGECYFSLMISNSSTSRAVHEGVRAVRRYGASNF